MFRGFAAGCIRASSSERLLSDFKGRSEVSPRVQVANIHMHSLILIAYYPTPEYLIIGYVGCFRVFLRRQYLRFRV